VAEEGDLATAGMGLVQNLVLFVAIIQVIVGATRILGTGKHAVQPAQAESSRRGGDVTGRVRRRT
jgi:hypothetical protein